MRITILSQTLGPLDFICRFLTLTGLCSLQHVHALDWRTWPDSGSWPWLHLVQSSVRPSPKRVPSLALRTPLTACSVTPHLWATLLYTPDQLLAAAHNSRSTMLPVSIRTFIAEGGLLNPCNSFIWQRSSNSLYFGLFTSNHHLQIKCSFVSFMAYYVCYRGLTCTGDCFGA